VRKWVIYCDCGNVVGAPRPDEVIDERLPGEGADMETMECPICMRHLKLADGQELVLERPQLEPEEPDMLEP
jgi:hypothetical protein